MEKTHGIQSAEQNESVNENLCPIRKSRRQRNGLIVSRGKTNCIEQIFIKMEPFEEWTTCDLGQNIEDPILNGTTAEVRPEHSIKMETTSDSEQYMMDETGRNAQECIIADLSCWVKMEQEDEFPDDNGFVECRSGKEEETRHLVDQTERLEDFSRPERRMLRPWKRRPQRPTAEEEYLILERARTRKSKRLTNETAAHRSRRLERQRTNRANETDEVRKERLERRRIWRLMYMEQETEEQRALRLARQKIAGLKWRSKQTEEQRNARIEGVKMAKLRRLAMESEDEKLGGMEYKRIAPLPSHQKRKSRRAEQEIETRFEGAPTGQVDCTRVKFEW